MKNLRKTGLGMLSLVALAAIVPVVAQPQPKPAKAPVLTKATTTRLELVAGKPLTEEQKAAALTAETEYMEALKALNLKRDTDYAKALGMTVEQFQAAEKEARKKAAEAKKAEMEAKKAAE